MIHADAIEDALDQADTREVEQAFRALVTFPHGEEIGGPVTAEQLDDLFGRVTAELRLDQTQAPADMLEVIRERVGLPVPLHPRVSYGDAALLVQRYRDKWRAVFVTQLSGGED